MTNKSEKKREGKKKERTLPFLSPLSFPLSSSSLLLSSRSMKGRGGGGGGKGGVSSLLRFLSVKKITEEEGFS